MGAVVDWTSGMIKLSHGEIDPVTKGWTKTVFFE